MNKQIKLLKVKGLLPDSKIKIQVNIVDKLRESKKLNLFNYKDLAKKRNQTKLF